MGISICLSAAVVLLVTGLIDGRTRVERDTGLLQVKEIESKQLRADTLKATNVKADKIKSDVVVSSVIVVGSRRHRKRKRPTENPTEMRSFETSRSTPEPNTQLSSDFQTERRRYRKSRNRQINIDNSKPTVYRTFDLTGGKIIPEEPLNIDIHLGRPRSDPGADGTIKRWLEDNKEGSTQNFSPSRSQQRRDRIVQLDKTLEEPSRSRSASRQFSDIQEERTLETSDRSGRRSRKRQRPNDLLLQAAEDVTVSKDSSRGLLRAQDISAGSINTDSMTADQITADKIRSRTVQAKILNVKDRAPASMSLFEAIPQQQIENRHITNEISNRDTSNNKFVKPKGPNKSFSSDSAIQSKTESTNPFVRRRKNNSNQRGDPFVVDGKSFQESTPSLDLLGLSDSNQPHIQMYIEPAVKRQKIQYISRVKPRGIIFNNERSVPLAAGVEYISDNYKSKTKSTNLYNDYFFY